jgi:hypothetical protein
MAGFRAGWLLIRKLAGGQRAELHIEVGTGGMVHAHVMAYHRYILPAQLQEIREAVLGAIGGGTSQYRIDRVGTGKGQKGGVKEVAKYVTKGVAMNKSTANQTHPLLSAMVEAAFRGERCVQKYGDWKGLELDDYEDEESKGWKCPMCGSEEFHWRYQNVRTGEFADEQPRSRHGARAGPRS